MRQNGAFWSRYRPVAIFGKPGKPFRLPRTLPDVVKTEMREKDIMDWQQPLSESVLLVGHGSDPGDLVVDLTAGAFTSGAACATAGGRRYHGVEVRRDLCRLGRARIAAALT